jgi:hypothetical protein
MNIQRKLEIKMNAMRKVLKIHHSPQNITSNILCNRMDLDMDGIHGASNFIVTLGTQRQNVATLVHNTNTTRT